MENETRYPGFHLSDLGEAGWGSPSASGPAARPAPLPPVRSPGRAERDCPGGEIGVIGADDDVVDIGDDQQVTRFHLLTKS